MARPVVAILILTVVLISGCGASSPAEQGAIRLSIQARARALNTHDLPLYLSIISSAYKDDKGRDLARLRDALAISFKTFERISYQAEDQTIKVSGKQAEVAGKYRMKLVIRGREVVLSGKEKMILNKEHEGWKIVAGL